MATIWQITYLKYVFFNENIWISLTILQKFVAKDPIDNMPSVV